jgi:Zn-dependent peptidase ImmA (M78 family)/transcriptional regulator with XRE-family HTH domain
MTASLTNAEIGRRIAQKRESAGISRKDLATALGITADDVERVESGRYDDLPGDFVLIAARVLRTDFRYFVTYELDDEDAQTHRVYRALAEPTVDDEFRLRLFFHFATGEAELRSLLDVPLRRAWTARPSNPPRGFFKEHGQHVAREERKRLGLGDRSIPNMFDLVRGQGILLLRQHFRDSTLSGLTAVHPRAGTCVLVNYTDDLYRQIFSAAHEYAHVLFDQERLERDGCVVSYDRADRQEKIEWRANAFARSLLLPSEALERYWKRPTTADEIASTSLKIGRRYHVNTETALIAMKEVGWIDETTFEHAKHRRTRIPRTEKEDPDLPSSLTERQRERLRAAIERGLNPKHVELVARAIREELITFGRAAELLDIRRSELVAFFHEIGVSW